MYSLKEAPIFLEFLDMFLKKVKSKIKIKNTKKLFLYDKCICNKNHCNTFILKSRRKIEDGFYVYHTIQTNKGIFGIELLEDGSLIFMAIGNQNLPFEKEFKNFFKHSSTVKKTLQKSNKKKKLSKKNRLQLLKFFNKLRVDSMYFIDEDVDDSIKRYL